MTTRWQGWAGATSVTVIAVILVALDVFDAPIRRWWLEHAFTAAVVSGILVLAVTVLIADQVVSLRQLKDRARAMAAQAAIVMSQASQASKAVLSMLGADGDRDAASDEVRTYMTMLLISAPVLIDARLSRSFLEDAQRLGVELARALARSDVAEVSSARIEQAVAKVRVSSAPLLEILRPEQRTAVTSDDLDSGASDGLDTSSP